MENRDLYHIGKEFDALMNAIELNDGEISDEQMEALAIYEENMQQGCVSLGGVIESVEDRIAALTTRKKKFEEEIKRLKSSQDTIRRRIAYYMDKYGVNKIKTDDCTITLSYTERAVAPEDVESLPERFVRVKKEANLVEIKKALKEGEVINGCYLDNTNPKITIK